MTTRVKSWTLQFVPPEKALVHDLAPSQELERLGHLNYGSLTLPQRAIDDGQRLAAILGAHGTKAVSPDSLRRYKHRVEGRRSLLYVGPFLGTVLVIEAALVVLTSLYQLHQSATVDGFVTAFPFVALGLLVLMVLWMFVVNMYTNPWQHVPLGTYRGTVAPEWQTYLTRLAADSVELEYVIDSFKWGFHRYDHFLVVKLGAAEAYIYVWRDNYRYIPDRH